MKSVRFSRLSPVGWFDCCFSALTLAGILTAAALTGQSVLKTLPCCISVAVFFLGAKANRYMYLLGGINSLIYAAAYFLEGLYGNMSSALVTGFLAQMILFLRWTRTKREGNTPYIRLMTPRNRMLAGALLLLFYVGTYAVLRLIGGNDVLLDSMSFALGIFVVVLQMGFYFENLFLWFLNAAIALVLWSIRIQNDPAAITYLLISVYNIVKIAESFLRWHGIYRRQRLQTAAEPDREEQQ